MIDLSQRRDELEAEAKRDALRVRRWLEIAQIAVPAVLRAAAAGNVICRAAAEEFWPLLPVSAFDRSASSQRNVEPALGPDSVAGTPACAGSAPVDFSSSKP